MQLAAVRKYLEHQAIRTVEAAGCEEGTKVYVGSRVVEYRETEGAIWNFGVAVSIPKGYDDSLEDFDALMAGEHRVKDAIEKDRSLGSLVMDADVTAIRGPQRSPDDSTTLTEWVVKIRAEE